MGIIFNRKKPVEPVVEEIGNANLAKRLRMQTVTVQRNGVTTTQQVAKPVVEGSVVGVEGREAGPSSLSMLGSAEAQRGQPFYQFETTSDPNERGRGWYITMAIFFAGVVALNVVLELYLSAVVIVLLALIVFTTTTRREKKITARFYGTGLKLNDHFYPWSEFSKFWILYEPPALKRLHLQRRSRLINELTIELGRENPLKIRDLLVALLPEDQSKEESRMDLVTRTFKL